MSETEPPSAPQPMWVNCEHEWKTQTDSQFHNDKFEDVVCIKCGCPGERVTGTGDVFFPAT